MEEFTNLFSFSGGPVIILLAGAVSCFFGKKLLGILILVLGFLIGFYFLGPMVMTKVGEEATWIPWVAGVVIAVLATVAWKVSFFLMGSILGMFILRSVLPENTPGLVLMVSSFAIGTLVQLFKTPVIALATALAGSSFVSTGFVMLSKQMGMFSEGVGNSESAETIVKYSILLIFTALGYMSQMKREKN